MEVLNEYAAFLWRHFQHDWSVISNPWVHYTVIPLIVYLLFFLAKWYILLIPITLPCSILSKRNMSIPIGNKQKKLDSSSKNGYN